LELPEFFPAANRSDSLTEPSGTNAGCIKNAWTVGIGLNGNDPYDTENGTYG
jgi:hypothetical protein